jgi:hypothetical protein
VEEDQRIEKLKNCSKFSLAKTTSSLENSSAPTMSSSFLLGNIDKSYCSLFWLYSIFALVGLVAFLGLNIFRGISKKKSASFYLGIAVTSSAFFIMYLQNQLFYNMCKHSVQ